ncbi:uncharacterized protein LOC106656050 [Trichogramma pretiosum]|uniref:uncharacterized protein LOC106656050 n=1 Tax=Trichogramma pretiosum TaxID=7493 RepID=UPI0006C95897|nr:uncharacterized protein LOC106656050 [Trichogramma pretiosum]XP_014232172.1 uncharacterized protein LOC106656050 [Trichogramma pretiosum]
MNRALRSRKNTSENVAQSRATKAVPKTVVGKTIKNSATKPAAKKIAEKKKNSSNESSVSSIKSPVLRDRTNTTNELSKVDVSSQKSETTDLTDAKKTITTRSLRKLEKDKDLKSNGGIKKSTTAKKLSVHKNKIANASESNSECTSGSTKEIVQTRTRNLVKNNNAPADSEKNSSPSKSKTSVPTASKNSIQSSGEVTNSIKESSPVKSEKVHQTRTRSSTRSSDTGSISKKEPSSLEKEKGAATEIESSIIRKMETRTRSSTRSKNQSSNSEKESSAMETDKVVQTKSRRFKNTPRKHNMSIEDVERMLNQSDSEDESMDAAGTAANKESSKTAKTEIKKVPLQGTKKFFKCSSTSQTKTLPVTEDKIVHKQVKSKITTIETPLDDNVSFKSKISNYKSSDKTAEKQLRPRAIKNYCEISKLLEEDDSNDSVKENNEPDKKNKNETEKANKVQVPIYKTLPASQQKIEDIDKIYEIPEEWLHEDQNIKKPKKKSVKRLKKASRPKPIIPCKTKENINGPKQHLISPQTNIVKSKPSKQNEVDNNNLKDSDKVSPSNNNEPVISEDFQEMGESTFEEAPTMKIISDQILKGNDRIKLATTPNAPKTINSELKLFGMKNAITSKPTTQYMNMVNHSLIQKSMSPIKKVIDNFDVGSPWRVTDTFTRIQKVVQSTPQTNKKVATLIRKPVVKMLPVPEKSIGSQETIHLSSLPDKSGNNGSATQVSALNEGTSPKNVNTNLSNVSPVKSIDQSTSHPENIPFETKNPQINQNNSKSPRKFGTVLCNVSPVKSVNQRNQQSSQNNSKSPRKFGTVLPNISPMKSITSSYQQSFQNNSKSPKKLVTNLSPTKTINQDLQVYRVQLEPSKPVTEIFKDHEVPNIDFEIGDENTSPNKSPRKLQKSVIETLKSVSPQKSTMKNFLEPKKSSEIPNPKLLRQTTLHGFLNLEEVPESTRILTPDGIFADVHSTPINGRKQKKTTEEPNLENAFGFDDGDDEDEIEVCPSINVMKKKLFTKMKAKPKTSRISYNTVKQALLTNIMNTKKSEEKMPEIFEKNDQNDSDDSDNSSVASKDYSFNAELKKNDSENLKESILTFSDTFDLHSEQGDDSLVPEKGLLFFNLEPVHFSTPARRSYGKRKRQVCVNTTTDCSASDTDDPEEKPKRAKKRPKNKRCKEEEKKMKDWVKKINSTFDEIDHFDLVVE